MRPYTRAVQPHSRLWAVIWALGALFVASPADAKPEERPAPSQFGRTYRANRSSLVRIRGEKPGSRWGDGVMIGAEGEILFGVDPMPTPVLTVILADGITRSARLLGFDRDLGIAVARLDGPAAVVPPKVDLTERLFKDRWVVVMTHDRRGRATSHAGQVAGSAGGGLLYADVPGRPGSPILSARGVLLGMAVTRGRRRVKVRPLASLMGVLRRVVMSNERTP